MARTTDRIEVRGIEAQWVVEALKWNPVIDVSRSRRQPMCPAALAEPVGGL
jgi:hypothetical protein